MKTARRLILVLAITMPSLAFAALSYMTIEGIGYLPIREQDGTVLADAKSMGRGAAILGGLSGLFLGFGIAATAPAFRKKTDP